MVDLVMPTRSSRSGSVREVAGVAGEPGAFTLRLRRAGTPETRSSGDETIECGAIIIATGFAHFDPGRATQMYGYYEFPDVITQPDLELMISERRVVRPSNGKPPSGCASSSALAAATGRLATSTARRCAAGGLQEAIEIRQMLPDSKVLIFYIDMRMYGYWENEIYWPAQERHHVQYVKGLITEVLPKGDRLLVRGEDTTMGRPMEVPMDLVVLSVGMEPSPGTRECAGDWGSSRTSTGSSRLLESLSTLSAQTGRRSSPAVRP